MGADRVMGFGTALAVTGRCEAGLMGVQEVGPYLVVLAQTVERRRGVDYSAEIGAVIERFDLVRPFTPDETDETDDAVAGGDPGAPGAPGWWRASCAPGGRRRGWRWCHWRHHRWWRGPCWCQ